MGPVRHTAEQYDVRTAWYNYTRRDGTTYAGMLLSRNGTKTGRYMILAYDVTLSVRCSDACSDDLYSSFWFLYVSAKYIFAEHLHFPRYFLHLKAKHNFQMNVHIKRCNIFNLTSVLA